MISGISPTTCEDPHARSSPQFDRPMSGIQLPRIFKLPIDAACCKAREIIDQNPKLGHVLIVENSDEARFNQRIK
jgi:hypothetical protein